MENKQYWKCVSSNVRIRLYIYIYSKLNDASIRYRICDDTDNEFSSDAAYDEYVVDLNKYIFINAYPVIDRIPGGYIMTYCYYDIDYNKIYLTNIVFNEKGNIENSKITKVCILYINRV